MSATRVRQMWGRVGSGMGGLAAGLAIAFLVWGRGTDPARAEIVIPAPATTVVSGDAGTKPRPTTVTPTADSAAEAASGFLEAEVEGDLAGSYAYLSSADRAELPTLADWESAHADLLPPILDFELGSAIAGGVAVSLRLESGIDLVTGLTPARANAEIALIEEDGGWRIDLGASRIVPLLPSEDGIATAAAEWSGCDPRNLIGPLESIADLCATDGPLQVGQVSPLEDSVDLTVFVAAYGPDVMTWARVVPTRGPVNVRVVLAPIDDEWAVIGALPAEGG